MKNKNLLYLFVYCDYFIVFSCKEKNKNQLFSSLSSKQSGIDFSNNIDETKLKGGALNEFGYMGGGVGILDINNDGLKDIFFCGNQVSSRLYLNKGEHHFEDKEEKI